MFGYGVDFCGNKVLMLKEVDLERVKGPNREASRGGACGNKLVMLKEVDLERVKGIEPS